MRQVASGSGRGTPSRWTVGEEKLAGARTQAKPKEAQGTFTLKLSDRGGTRTVTFPGVTFPQLPR
jgi:hypothetical protein